MNKKLLRKASSLVVVNPKVMNGVPRFKNTRIPVSLVVDHFKKGWNVREINDYFPDVKLTVINKLMSIVSSEFKI